jgi:hypothetical protein
MQSKASVKGPGDFFYFSPASDDLFCKKMSSPAEIVISFSWSLKLLEKNAGLKRTSWISPNLKHPGQNQPWSSSGVISARWATGLERL